MSRFIDTMGPVNAFSTGRSQSLAELQNRQGQDRAAEQQRIANEELAMQQQRLALAQQEQMRQRQIDEGVSNVFREQYSRMIGPAPVAPGGIGPVQPDGFEDFRGSIATAPLEVLRAMGPFISSRTKLNELVKRLPELEKQRSMIAQDSPLRLILDHMIDNVRVGDTAGFEQAARQYVTAQVKQAENQQKVAANDALLQQLASDLSVRHKIPMDEAMRSVRLTKENIQNQERNKTGQENITRAMVDSVGDLEYEKAKDNALVAEKALEKADPDTIDERTKQYLDAKEKVRNEYKRVHDRMAGASPKMVQPPPVDVHTQASVIQTLRSKLGRDPTDDEIDSALSETGW